MNAGLERWTVPLWVLGAVLGGCGGDLDSGHADDRSGRTAVEGVVHHPTLAPDSGGLQLGDALLVVPRDESVFFHRVTDAVRLSNGTIAVADAGRDEVLVFTASGRTDRLLGGRGEGPGQFLALSRLAVRGDTLIAWESRGRRVTTFAPDGSVLSTKRGPALPGNIERWVPARTDLHFALVTERGAAGPVEGLVRPARFLVRFGSRVDTLGRFSGPELFWSAGEGAMSEPVSTLFGPRTHMAGGGTPWLLAVGDGASPSFEIRDESGRILRTVTWDEERPGLSADEYATRERERLQLELQMAGARDPASIRRRFQNLPIPESAPYFESLFVDDLGSVWLERRGATSLSSSRWMVFGSSGRWEGEVALPGRVRPLWAGADHLIAVHRDSLDVETVRVYPLRRPSPR